MSEHSADEFLAAGDLEGARRELVETLRSAAGDERARMFLFQLFLVLGEWDKASNQLRALAQLTPEAQMLALAYSQLIAAERQRADAFTGKAPFPRLIGSVPWLDQLAEALEANAKGDRNAVEARDSAFDNASDSAGTWDSKPFAMFADSDSRFGPCFEAIVGGRWGLIAFESVSRLRSEGPKDLRDLVWLPVELTPRGGNSTAGFLPVRYPGTELRPDAALRLAKRTEWRPGPLGDEGLGQRQWFTDGGTEMGILELRDLRFA